MKKHLLLFPICLVSFGLAACNQATSSSVKEDKDYYVVNFNYNTETNKSNYLSIVVNKGQVLNAPKDPTAEDLCFENWYKEAACENKYLRWGLEIDSDFTLYANWTSYEALDIETKVSKFQEALKEVGKDAVQVNQTCNATVMYPFMGEDAVFTVKDKYIYKRYKNLTEKEYYQVDDDGKNVMYGKEQFRYDANNFYDVYVDFDDASNNETNTSKFKEENIESFISIDFQNLFHACENEFVYYAKQGDKYDSETFEYAFTGNFTRLNSKLENYSYSEGYYLAQMSESAGNYVTVQYAYNFGLTFQNGKISKANVQIEFLYAIGQEVYQYNQESSVYEFFYNNGNYPDFTGTLL